MEQTGYGHWLDAGVEEERRLRSTKRKGDIHKVDNPRENSLGGGWEDGRRRAGGNNSFAIYPIKNLVPIMCRYCSRPLRYMRGKNKTKQIKILELSF